MNDKKWERQQTLRNIKLQPTARDAGSKGEIAKLTWGDSVLAQREMEEERFPLV